MRPRYRKSTGPGRLCPEFFRFFSQLQERPQWPLEVQGDPPDRREVICLQKVDFDHSRTASGVQCAERLRFQFSIISRELLTIPHDRDSPIDNGCVATIRAGTYGSLIPRGRHRHVRPVRH
jgi:hypothetical protein